jgi:ubiquinone/menaquinone biosynthesis C-methylase UbiE
MDKTGSNGISVSNIMGRSQLEKWACRSIFYRRTAQKSGKIQRMDHFKNIYSGQAEEYHRMIAVEDVDGNLLKTLHQITDWENKTIFDLGSGTGRIPLLFSQTPARFICLDLYRAMLRENGLQRDEAGGNWALVEGDMRSLPYPDGIADIAMAGWSIGHLRAWFSQDWQYQIGRILQEMQRVVKPGGVLIICETMSTASLVPRPPAPELAEYYVWLEQKHHFLLDIIPTDYQFASVEQAVEFTEFFFGGEMAAQIHLNRWARLPEWTGIWHKGI